MRRSLLIGAAFLLASAGGAVAAVPPTTPAAKPPLAAKLTACTTGDQPASRAATFTASMPALKGTKRMTMRFRLLERRDGMSSYKMVDLPEWADVERSDPGRPGLIFTKRVEGLLAPAAYKAVVRFRWYDKKGRLQRDVSRTTGPCHQPDPRPDLQVGELTGRVRDADTAIYEVVVRNDGRGVAGAFGVGLTIRGQVQPPFILGPLAPGTRDRGQLVGPRCTPGETITIELDADGVVDEADEANNLVERPCPLAS